MAVKVLRQARSLRPATAPPARSRRGGRKKRKRKKATVHYCVTLGTIATGRQERKKSFQKFSAQKVKLREEQAG